MTHDHVAIAHEHTCFMRSCLDHPAPSWVGPLLMVALLALMLTPGIIMALRS